MNYQKIYNSLIERAKNRTIEGYSERHHIIPRCMSGSNESENLVQLTPEEHYVAHQLLVKIYPKSGVLIKAAAMMVPNRPSNKLYGWIRRKLAREMSVSQSGKGNSQFGTKWIYSDSEQRSKKIPKECDIPQGWRKGRKVSWKTAPMDSCPVCGKKKLVKRKVCSRVCNGKMQDKIEELMACMIEDYKKGTSISRCLINQGLNGTGKNHTRLKNALINWGLV